MLQGGTHGQDQTLNPVGPRGSHLVLETKTPQAPDSCPEHSCHWAQTPEAWGGEGAIVTERRFNLHPESLGQGHFLAK